MSQITVSEEALRELAKETLDGGHLGDLTVPEDEEPANVNPVVDPSASVTDPINPNFVPQTKPELDVALHQLTKEVPIDNVPKFYKAVRAELDAEQDKAEKEEEMKRAAQDDADHVEEAVRRAVRKTLGEKRLAEVGDLPPVKKIPMGVHGDEYMYRVQKARDDLAGSMGGTNPAAEKAAEEEKSGEPEVSKRHGAYKKTAIGGMLDVGGSSFEEIAKELNFSVAGAKQAVDKALEKARWLAQDIDSDSLEIMVLQTMNEYIALLNKTGELSPADVQLMKDHPDVVRELDGFREFLATAIKHKRKENQRLEDPLGEHRKHVIEALNSVGMELETKKPTKKKPKKKAKVGDFTKASDKRDAENYEKYASLRGWGKKVKKDIAHAQFVEEALKLYGESSHPGGDESLSEPRSESISAVLNDINDARRTMTMMNGMTPFSNWYKGDHGKARTRLMRAVRSLVLLLKKSEDPREVQLLQAAKAYYDSLSMKRSGGGSDFTGAVAAWQGSV